MASPQIELVRGDNWTNPLWESRQSLLLRAAQCAHEGLVTLGLSYSEPKQGTVRRVTSTEDVALGRAFDSQRFELNVTPRSEDRILRSTRHAEWSSTLVHEAVHCVRFESVRKNSTCADYVVTEGLAYVAEQRYAVQFGNQLESIYDHTISPQVLADATKDYLYAPLNDAPSKHWYNSRSNYGWLNKGELFGVHQVEAQLAAGRTLQELIALPSEEVLAL